jgi:hypothetical protein
MKVTQMRKRKSCRIVGQPFRRHVAQKQEGEAGRKCRKEKQEGNAERRSRDEKQKGDMRNPVSIGGKALAREPTCVARSCGIDQPVDEVVLVFVFV